MFVFLTLNLRDLSNFFYQKSCYKSYSLMQLKNNFLVQLQWETLTFTALKNLC